MDECQWVEDVLLSNDLGKRPGKTLERVARYYIHYEKRKPKEVYRELEHFLLRCDPTVYLPRWARAIERAIKYAKKYPLIDIEGIHVTQAEIDAISGLSKPQERRLAFTLLCAAKYWDIIKPGNDGWVRMSAKTIFLLAGVRVTHNKQYIMLHELMVAGLIGFSNKVDNLDVRVSFINSDSESVMFMTDMRNIGNQYMMYCGESYVNCAQCDLTIKKNSNAQKYCDRCAEDMYFLKTAESDDRKKMRKKE